MLQTIMPKRLQPGDEIRVVAPSRSLTFAANTKDIATQRLESLGFQVTFSRHAEEHDLFASSSIASRVEDLHEAFADQNVKAVLTVIGGFNCNQLLKYLDYDLIKANPKILSGYSDITALGNAIFAKTGLITYSGPHFSTFGMVKGLEYTIEYFRKAVMQADSYKVEASTEWSDDSWYFDQEKRTFYPNEGSFVINEGQAEGTIIGGNLCTLNLLQGTPYMPSLQDAILFIEDDNEVLPPTFDRDLQSLIHLPDFSGVKGIAIGRFQKASEMTREKLVQIIRTKEELQHLPVVADMDFGHTSPIFTFPIGGRAKLHAKSGETRLILSHS